MDSAAAGAASLQAVRGGAGAAARSRAPRRYQAVPDAPQEAQDIHELTSPARQGRGRDCKGGHSRSNQREATFKRKEKKAGTGEGVGGGGKKTKRPGHARDGSSGARLEVLAALPDPVLGGWFQNSSKAAALFFCKALSWARSTSINYSLGSFRRETDANSLPGVTAS